MAPVQAIYSTPGGLLGSRAPMAATPISQSMYRSIDIDAERMYWTRRQDPGFAFERYGYVELVVGYFLYYCLHAGNWEYYFFGAWVRQSDQLAQLLRPGLFLFGQPITIPWIVAMPLVRNWQRSPALYGRENLAERFRRQLNKLGLDVGRVLAVPVDCFDTTLERDPEFARDVLALESRHLQRITARRAQAGSIDLKTDG